VRFDVLPPSSHYSFIVVASPVLVNGPVAGSKRVWAPSVSELLISHGGRIGPARTAARE